MVVCTSRLRWITRRAAQSESQVLALPAMLACTDEASRSYCRPQTADPWQTGGCGYEDRAMMQQLQLDKERR